MDKIESWLKNFGNLPDVHLNIKCKKINTYFHQFLNNVGRPRVKQEPFCSYREIKNKNNKLFHAPFVVLHYPLE